MGYWNSMGQKGGVLEELINLTNDIYRKRGLCVVQKIPTPITPVTISRDKRTISLAYFDKKSTVDYIGVVRGRPIAFDAKETAQKSLSLGNIHKHQIRFMADFIKQGGAAFLMVRFTVLDEIYLLPFEILLAYWEGALAGGRKSIPYSAFKKDYQIPVKGGGIVDYLALFDGHPELLLDKT